MYKGRILAIDYGAKRVGLAITDPLQMLAQPLDTIEPSSLIFFIKNYHKDNPLVKVIIGYPLHKDGSENPITTKINKFIRNFEKVFPTIPIERVDESYSSNEAASVLHQTRFKNWEKEKATIDKVAAAIILREYLDRIVKP